MYLWSLKLGILQLIIIAVSSWVPSTTLPKRIAGKLLATNPIVSTEPTSSTTLGNLRPILLPGESQLGTMGVPTFASEGCPTVVDPVDSTKSRGLEGVLNQGPALMVDNVLSSKACEQMIRDCNQIGFGNYNSGKNNHGALQILVSKEMSDQVAQRLSQHVNIPQVEALRDEMKLATSAKPQVQEDVRLVFAGLNRRWRVYRYDSNGHETFAPHIDAGFPPSGISQDGSTLVWDDSDQEGDEIVSRLTVLMYLNDDFVGGETNFFGPHAQYGDELNKIASVRPLTGSCLLFPQGVGEEAVEYARENWPLHEGSPVRSGRPKYVIRSDVMFVTQKEPLLLDDKLFRDDYDVRQAFLPTSPGLHPNLLGHTASLYNPHMGVENLGPLLYSFLRFTKKRRIVEIGAGYTSLWILQAIKENDDELRRIKALEDEGRCRLLDYPWTVPSAIQNLENESPLLLCIDNCEHQKETATGASAVANALGLDPYFEFMKGDAFDLELESNSVDVLWCDFGVGSRMSEFATSAWKSIRPGGFFLCHSTLTNENTRQWLEAIRARSSQEVTGIPPEEYIELSLLEPHKSFQNSISIIQKRQSSDGQRYEEPIYSTFA
ncbi:unnamed protein product [Cylindrotheca closterium]|uniref:Fe2OG dioxygenase domain-containing protein n=1 Tax=Cylindrotheca closterium TaxID=2856 RepID=A0AAD2FM83_9STRA|nr:unnamed protein product [Cylindrotheca closterium]